MGSLQVRKDLLEVGDGVVQKTTEMDWKTRRNVETKVSGIWVEVLCGAPANLIQTYTESFLPILSLS